MTDGESRVTTLIFVLRQIGESPPGVDEPVEWWIEWHRAYALLWEEAAATDPRFAGVATDTRLYHDQKIAALREDPWGEGRQGWWSS